ncbi:MAG: FtsX-like permease family protein [Ignavibacteriales bacterium]|nr:FtsX-like permease family protein [Ignavibacteriales bacterium]
MRIFKLMFKNALRHKLRTSLTILGIAIAVMAFGFLRTVVTAWYAGVEASAANRLVTRNAVSFIFPLPLAYRDKIARIPGVETVSYMNWFQGVYIDKNQFFARFAADVQTALEVYPEFIVPPDQLEAFTKERNACMVGADLAKQYNFKIGDVIPIEGDIYPGKWDFVVRAIYQPRDEKVDGTQMWFHWAYLDERMRQDMPGRAGEVGWYIIRISNPNDGARISEEVDQLFKNSRAETKTESERAFQEGFVQGTNLIIVLLNFMSFVIIGIIMLVLGNTMIMSARERTKEYAVLKTIGFSGSHLTKLIAGESMIISILGGALGLLLTYPIVGMFSLFVPKSWFPIFYIEPITIVLAGTSALVVGVIAALFPIQRAVRTSIVDGLRFVG